MSECLRKEIGKSQPPRVEFSHLHKRSVCVARTVHTTNHPANGAATYRARETTIHVVADIPNHAYSVDCAHTSLSHGYINESQSGTAITPVGLCEWRFLARRHPRPNLRDDALNVIQHGRRRRGGRSGPPRRSDQEYQRARLTHLWRHEDHHDSSRCLGTTHASSAIRAYQSRCDLGSRSATGITLD